MQTTQSRPIERTSSGTGSISHPENSYGKRSVPNENIQALDTQCIHRLIERQVEKSPDAVAVVFEDRKWTYRELNEQANRLANQLLEIGVGLEVAVGVAMERCLELAAAVVGIWKAGGIFVPLDPDFPQERLSFLIHDAQVQAVLVQDQSVDRVREWNLPVLRASSIYKHPAPGNIDNPTMPVSGENLCSLLYTSGSTGTPKAVMMPHRVVTNRVFWSQTQEFALQSTDRSLLTCSISFGSFLAELVGPLMSGAAVVLARPGGYKDMDYLISVIEDQEITCIYPVPTVLRLFLDRFQLVGFDRCASLRHINSHGEALPPALQDLVTNELRADLHKFYGLSEAPGATYWNCRKGENPQIVTIGRPTEMQVHLLDDDFQQVPDGEVGELFLAGPGLTRGYRDRPDLTAEKYLPYPFTRNAGERMFRTGDLGRRLPDGVIEFLGRADQQVKVRGLRIHLGEIETILERHPQVQTAVAVAREDQPEDKRLVAYVVAKPGPPLSGEELRNYLKAKLPEFMIPAVFVTLDALPLTANGKVDRRALPEPESQKPTMKAAAYDEPQTAMETAIAAIWRETLRLDYVGLYDNFFDLGGSSLTYTQTATQMERTLGVRVIPDEVLQQTLGQLANLCEERQKSARGIKTR